MKHLSPGFFVGFVGDSDYPLWGLTGIIILGVVVFGLRLRLTSGRFPVGDVGIVLFNLYIGIEWGGA